MDLQANLAPEDRARGLTLAPGARALVPTGLALEIPPGHEVQVRPRSGLALRQGLTVLNTPGTIDSDYRGEVGVILVNLGAEPVTIAHGDRIAQMVLAPVARIGWAEAEALAASAARRGRLRLHRHRRMTLAPDELARYARHIVLHEIGGPGQQRLRAARVLVVGAGGLGSPALLYLAAAGVGTLGIVDDDAVSLSNLQRQVLHATAEIGRPKTDERRPRARPPQPARRRRAAPLPPRRRERGPPRRRPTTSFSTAATTSPPATSSTPPASRRAARSSRRR